MKAGNSENLLYSNKLLTFKVAEQAPAVQGGDCCHCYSSGSEHKGHLTWTQAAVAMAVGLLLTGPCPEFLSSFPEEVGSKSNFWYSYSFHTAAFPIAVLTYPRLA
uniref:Uncharacterized protein n=1 Tax=Sphaerodactylus townsendi TaxID=933632 RepID=A0ACB8G3E8_9SAUR